MKKSRVCLISAVALIVAVTASGLIFRNSLALAIGSHYIDTGYYDKASHVLYYGNSPGCEAARKYASTRIEIKNCYKYMLSNYESNQLNMWQKTLDEISCNGNEKISTKANELYNSIESITEIDSQWDDVDKNIDSLLNVFSEYNRLHIQINGENTPFIPAEEFNRLKIWQDDLNSVIKYASEIKNYEDVYLLSYFIKEAQSEIIQLNQEMNSVIKSGYSLTDNVRYSDNSARNFPTINNGNGVSFTFADKELYMQYLRAGIRSHLISEYLTSYYYDKES